MILRRKGMYLKANLLNRNSTFEHHVQYSQYRAILVFNTIANFSILVNILFCTNILYFYCIYYAYKGFTFIILLFLFLRSYVIFEQPLAQEFPSG